jgi:hypothetical protein
MTAAVRLFCFQGLVPAPVVAGDRLSYDSVQLLKWPALGRDLLSCTTGATDISEATAAASKTALALIQVEAGKTIHYEIIPENAAVVEADETSPTLSGQTTIQFGPGWRLSVLEAA